MELGHLLARSGLTYPACTEHKLYYIVTCGLFESIFPHYLINGTIFGGEEEGNFIEHEMCILNLYILWQKQFSF